MNLAELNLCPDWPAVMDVETATYYLNARPVLLEALIERGYLSPLTDRHRLKTFLRADIDAALLIAKQNGDDLRIS